MNDLSPGTLRPHRAENDPATQPKKENAQLRRQTHTSAPTEQAGLTLPVTDTELLAAFESRLIDCKAALAAFERDEESGATYAMRDFLDLHGRRLLSLARAGART